MLPTEQRLRDNRDFRRTYDRGRSHVNSLAVLYVLRQPVETATRPVASVVPHGPRRIGFVVSKKQGNSVVRNRIKRRLREAVRGRLNDLRPVAADIVFVGRSRIKNADWKDVCLGIDDLLRRAGLLDKAHPDRTL